MDEFVALMTALLDAFVKRRDRRARAGRALPAKSTAQAGVATPSAPLPSTFAPGAAEPPAVVPPRRLPAVAVPSPEAGLVTGLFANPASLAAAFIVAEILAKPVALRD